MTAMQVGRLVQREEPDHQGEGRLQRHQRPERAGVETPQREHLEGERHDGQQHGQADADQQQLRREAVDDCRPATAVATTAATGIEIASPEMPAAESPTFWVSRMYAAQQTAAPSA